jgi:hypothetical protein
MCLKMLCKSAGVSDAHLLEFGLNGCDVLNQQAHRPAGAGRYRVRGQTTEPEHDSEARSYTFSR